MGKVFKEFTKGRGSVHLWPSPFNPTYAIELKARAGYTDFIERITAPNFDAALREANGRYGHSHHAHDTRAPAFA